MPSPFSEGIPGRRGRQCCLQKGAFVEQRHIAKKRPPAERCLPEGEGIRDRRAGYDPADRLRQPTTWSEPRRRKACERRIACVQSGEAGSEERTGVTTPAWR